MITLASNRVGRAVGRGVFYLVVTVVLTGCGAYKVRDVDPKTGLYPALVTIDRKNVDVFEPLAGYSDRKFVYLQVIGGQDVQKFAAFVEDFLQKNGFPPTLYKRDLAKMVVKAGLAESVTNLSDPISLNKLAQEVGPYLVISCRDIGRYGESMEVVIFDPVEMEPALSVHRSGSTWLEKDREFTYPVFNIVLDWVKESRALGPAPATKELAPGGDKI